MKNSDLRALLKRVVELVMPDLRSYYRVVRKARVVKVYASDGNYWADVQPLRNDESVDENEPVISKVEIPIIWAGPVRGIVCPPAAGAYCDLEYYDGDPDYPRISNFRWHGMKSPECEIGAFIIQKKSGVFIKIDADDNIEITTSAKVKINAGDDKTESIGGTWSVDADGGIIFTGNMNVTGNLEVSGNIDAGGTIIDSGGNTNHHSH
jgi:hypothetical protein